ncbi:hypothetical protein CEXT_677271 [Caerostris extrusa]|uniref:Uncharacterized protein n=1 Tax=Caerostris extrusa TaxID=172846 RepID=A0AAV4NWS9_CAEEX|nr:hypothetical protein CEXT_677271 [Caerostris extrusa]
MHNWAKRNRVVKSKKTFCSEDAAVRQCSQEKDNQQHNCFMIYLPPAHRALHSNQTRSSHRLFLENTIPPTQVIPLPNFNSTSTRPNLLASIALLKRLNTIMQGFPNLFQTLQPIQNVEDSVNKLVILIQALLALTATPCIPFIIILSWRDSIFTGCHNYYEHSYFYSFFYRNCEKWQLARNKRKHFFPQSSSRTSGDLWPRHPEKSPRSIYCPLRSFYRRTTERDPGTRRGGDRFPGMLRDEKKKIERELARNKRKHSSPSPRAGQVVTSGRGIRRRARGYFIVLSDLFIGGQRNVTRGLDEGEIASRNAEVTFV